jgi:hypothetical protein
VKTPALLEGWPPLFLGLLFYGSRKFGTGLWITVLATAMVFAAKLPLSDWKDLLFVAAILIGGGTIADNWLGKKKESDVVPKP